MVCLCVHNKNIVQGLAHQRIPLKFYGTSKHEIEHNWRSNLNENLIYVPSSNECFRFPISLHINLNPLKTKCKTYSCLGEREPLGSLPSGLSLSGLLAFLLALLLFPDLHFSPERKSKESNEKEEKVATGS